jgi:hypothetical protein
MESNQIQWVGFLLHGIQNATCTNHIDKYGLSMRGVGEQLQLLTPSPQDITPLKINHIFP